MGLPCGRSLQCALSLGGKKISFWGLDLQNSAVVPCPRKPIVKVVCAVCAELRSVLLPSWRADLCFSVLPSIQPVWGTEIVGSRGGKGCLTCGCPRAAFCESGIYRTVKHFIIDTSELTQWCWAGNLLLMFMAVGAERRCSRNVFYFEEKPALVAGGAPAGGSSSSQSSEQGDLGCFFWELSGGEGKKLAEVWGC